MRQMGKFWKDEGLEGTQRLQSYAALGKIVTFAISLMGLLLVWGAEAFPRKSP